jgi:beta-lactamase class A
MMVAAPAALAPPAVYAPAEREVSFGRVAGRLPVGADGVAVYVGRRLLAVRRLRGRNFEFVVDLPRREVAVRLVALGEHGARRAVSVQNVIGLPAAATPRLVRARPSAALRARLRTLARSFGGTSAVEVEDLSTGESAAVDARLRFPAASTLKIAIALELLRSIPAKPARGSYVERLLRSMLVDSDNDAANQVEALTGGGSRVGELVRALGLADREMYGGYDRSEAGAGSIPITGKYTTARDLARLLALVHLAAGGKGLLVQRFRGEVTPSEARYLLYLLAQVPDRGKLGRFLPPGAQLLHKAGWISQARHDAGLLYWQGGVFVVAVMTYSPGGAGIASDVLAGRVARAALTEP